MSSSITRASSGGGAHASGFSLVEFLLSAFILLVVAGAVFSMLSETQQSASYQTEVQAVTENARIAMDTVERFLRQAGNNPGSIAGFEGVTINSATSVRARSDMTGSCGIAPCSGVNDPNKGDPDGDTSDANEDVTIQYNSGSRTLEVVPAGGNAQTVAGFISAFSLEYFDQNGAATAIGANVRKIKITITCSSSMPNPRTRQTFSTQMSSDVQLATRQ